MIINKKDDITHMTIGAAVINEFGLCLSIVYEINDLCKYARNGNLSVFVHSFHAQTYRKDTKVIVISEAKRADDQ